MQAVVLTIFLTFFTSVSLAALNVPGNTTGTEPGASVPAVQSLQVINPQGLLFLAEADTDQKDTNKPKSGDLVIPGEKKAESEKKCLNICRKWGEECIINPRTGARNCRRTCKDFGMECF